MAGSTRHGFSRWICFSTRVFCIRIIDWLCPSVCIVPSKLIMHKKKRFDRRAFTLIEILIAMMCLAVATGFTLKIHQSRAQYDRLALDRMRQQLRAENLAEELRAVSFDELTQAASKLSEQSSVAIVLTPVDTDSRSGQHVGVEVDSLSGTVRHHSWRWEPAP